ncbi:hypothetical protein MMC09_005384 [Bachmanniomyces sp. S44760]|nr:hypothetical protein [Bachmanniomyces sp. S44760]
MPIRRRLLRGDITYSKAKEDETNVLQKLTYWKQRDEFFAHLFKNRSFILAAAAHHLRLSSKEICRIANPVDWLHGSFNVCIPITVEKWKKHPGKRVIIRIPLPYRVGEAFRPGNADEKLRCEAGAYAWLQDNCPTVPIPQFFGFGLSTGQTVRRVRCRGRKRTNMIQFTVLENLPLLTRCVQQLRRRLLTWLGYPVPSRYVRHQNGDTIPSSLGTGYLLIEYIEETQGQMLSNTWNDRQHESNLRKNFFRDLSRILLNVAHVALPRIGSFIIDDDGFLSLTNRPLALEIQDLENEQIPVDIPREFTYSTVDSYVVDTLAFHDNRVKYQPNGTTHIGDGIHQISALTMMKAVSSLFFRRDLRRGPFMLNLTDLHQSNILVDEDWNIKCIIDLEWACSRPVEMLHPPHWLTNKSVDTMDADEYDKVHREFMDIFVNVEEELLAEDPEITKLSPIIKQGWEMGTFWYVLALQSPTGLDRLFYDHIQPRFAKGHEDDSDFFRIVMYYWATNVREFLKRKEKDKEDYDLRLREAFEA